MGVYIEGLDMPKEHSLWMVIHPNGQVWMRKRHYCQNLEGVEATELNLVRCKECKYFISPYENLIDADGLCDNMQVLEDKADFCSHGERRTNDSNT